MVVAIDGPAGSGKSTVAALLAVIPPLCFGGVWTDWIHRAFVFLVVSCPCALVVSVPLYADFFKKKMDLQDLWNYFNEYYKDEKFVRVLDNNVCPETKWVEGSNYVDVNVVVDQRTNRVIMMGAMDNLVKGAAGQAVQNMNLMFGLDEMTGLRLKANYF